MLKLTSLLYRQLIIDRAPSDRSARLKVCVTYVYLLSPLSDSTPLVYTPHPHPLKPKPTQMPLSSKCTSCIHFFASATPQASLSLLCYAMRSHRKHTRCELLKEAAYHTTWSKERFPPCQQLGALAVCVDKARRVWAIRKLEHILSVHNIWYLRGIRRVMCHTHTHTNT